MSGARLLIKHAVGGRTFVDTAKAARPFAVEETAGGGYAIEVKLPDDADTAELLRWSGELNVFVFQEDLEPVVKHWYYARSVEYDAAGETLRIEAASRLTYIPDHFTW